MILGGLFIVVSVFLVSGASIQNSLRQMLDETKKQVNPVITVELDLDALMKEMYGDASNDNKQSIDEELVKKISESSYVKDYSVYSTVSLSTQFSSEEKKEVSSQMPEGYVPPTNELAIFDSKNPELAQTKIELLSGELPGDSKLNSPILVSEEYAKEHNLKVGDKLNLNFSNGFGGNEGKESVASIAGIYKLTSDNNQIYLNKEKATFYATREYVSQAKEAQFSDDSSSSPIAKFEKVKVELKNPMDTDKFIEEIKNGGGDFSVIEFNSSYEQYKAISAMIDNVMNIFTIIQFVVFVVAAVIVSLIMLLSLRERKYEIGLLLALGETKFKILMQMFIEVATVLIISFIIGFGIATFIVNPQATAAINKEMQQTMSTAKKEPVAQRGPNYVEDKSTELEVDPEIKEQNNSENLKIVVFVFSGLLLIILLSTTIPTLRIIRKSPKTILTSTE